MVKLVLMVLIKPMISASFCATVTQSLVEIGFEAVKGGLGLRWQ